MSVVSWWKNLSVSKKLYSVVGLMAFLIAIELFTLFFAMNTLSAVRAFVGGEGLWSKAQKTSVFYLQRYVTTEDEKYYQLFLNQIKIPQGDHWARLELSKTPFNAHMTTARFVEGGNHPKDIPSMISLMRRFYRVPYLARALSKWEEADVLIAELIHSGEKLHQEISKHGPTNKRMLSQILEQLYEIDSELTFVENDFSYTLGEASRWLENLLMSLLVLAVLTVESTGVILTMRFGKALSKGLTELNGAANEIGTGNFTINVPVRSQDELGRLASSINLMASNLHRQTNERIHAEQANQTKNLFLANMSHEIRTPLNAILGFTDLLKDPYLNEDEKRQYLDIISRAGASLNTIINDILDISRIEAEKLKIENSIFSLTQLLEDLNIWLKLKCEEKGIHLEIKALGEVSQYIFSDPIRLRQILMNVVGNAIKFTEKGTITLNYEVVDSHLVFTVKDTGTGISPHLILDLFKPFSQGDTSVRKKYGGTGLGLVISQKLAHLLGGDIGLIQTQPSIGSEFYFKILYSPRENLGKSNKINISTSLPLNPPLLGKKILVAEDTQDNQFLIHRFLAKSGAQIIFANNGEECLQQYLQGGFDLILMDMQMPIMDGFTATRELRKVGCKLPIVALTGYAMKEDHDKCLESGCDDFLSKPVDRQRLVHMIASHLHSF